MGQQTANAEQEGIGPMTQEALAAGTQEERVVSSREKLFATFSSFLFYIFVIVTAIAVCVPLNPRMPQKGLDASWEFAMNEAVARHLSFGSDVMFTYGPYAAICTRSYDPATDARMLWGSSLIYLSFLFALLTFARGRKVYIGIMLLFLVTFGAEELVLFSYAFLLGIYALKVLPDSPKKTVGARDWVQLFAIVLLWSTLGLLPVVKGSLLLPFAASALLPATFLAYRKQYVRGAVVLFAPIAAAIVFWLAAGQSLGNIPSFLRGTIALTSGYTEAMATSWVVLPGMVGDGLVLLFLFASALVGLSIVRTRKIQMGQKWVLGLLFAAFWLVTFKHGFVKIEGASGAFFSLALCIFILGLLYMDKYLLWSLGMALTFTVTTSVTQDPVLREQVHQKFGAGVTWKGGQRRDILAFCASRALASYARSTYLDTWKTYEDAWAGLKTRLFHRDLLQTQYGRALQDIQNSYPLPVLNGTVDLYTYEVSALVATTNHWNPRPVFQSYSAYTRDLAELNERHLRGTNSPDWLILDIQTIDGRFPLLDDGISWPAVLDGYTPVSFSGQFELMRKRERPDTASSLDLIYGRSVQVGETVELPAGGGIVYAEVDLEPTLAGKVLTELFSPPQLKIVVGLHDGSTRTYRTVSEMMKTGFILSPLVKDTEEFSLLVNQDEVRNDAAQVDRISISPVYGGNMFWSSSYSLKLKRYVRK